MNAWRFDWGAIAELPEAEVAALLTGPNVLGEPFLVRGSGPAVYLVDAPPPLWAEYVDDTLPSALAAGDVVQVTLRMRNRGSIAWAPGQVKLAPVEPRDNDSPLCEPNSWLTCGRVTANSSIVEPGQNAKFDFAITADPAAAGFSVNQCWGLLIEGVHWFSDVGQGGPAEGSVCSTVEILAPTPPDAGVADAGDAGAVPDATGFPDGLEGDADLGGSDGGSAVADAAPVIGEACGCQTQRDNRNPFPPAVLLLAAGALWFSAKRRARWAAARGWRALVRGAPWCEPAVVSDADKHDHFLPCALLDAASKGRLAGGRTAKQSQADSVERNGECGDEVVSLGRWDRVGALITH
jgi:hypothetical protein